MATKVLMKHKDTGLIKTGFVGFSWTTFFFGVFPALFRGDFLTFLGFLLIIMFAGAFTAGIGSWIILIAWSFMYNKYYTTKLIEKGYEFCDSEVANANASVAIGLSR